MPLIEEFRAQGDWLFRWRSYLPFVLVALIGVAFEQTGARIEDSFHETWEYVCLSISFLGLIVRCIAVGYAPIRTSGRNVKRQIADVLNTTGMYSIVRHPLYLGNFLIGFGISFVMLVWWLPVIYSLLFWLYYERIMFAEEAFLRQKFGKQFTDWAEVTPAFWPRFRQWRRPDLPFSFRNMLRREYTGLIVVVLGHSGQEFVETFSEQGHVVWEVFWATFLIGGTTIYFVLRFMKRRTTLLDVPGRGGKAA